MASCYPQITEILVGAKHYYVVDKDEMSDAFRIVGVPEEENIGGFSVRSIFIPHHSYFGMLYRLGEYILIARDDEQQAMKILKIFSFKLDGISYVFISGLEYELTGVHISSGNPIVTQSTQLLMIKAVDILRKVMLYPAGTDKEYVAIDYERTGFPLQPDDIAIPQYPEPGDMVSINGEEGEIWLANIHSSDPTSKACQVYFYIPVENNSRLYRKEQHRLEKVHWDSILGLVSGKWHGEAQYLVDACIDT